MTNLAQDLRFGLRLLRRSPGFTLVAILSLALGIGANTAIFSMMDALLLRSLPVQQPDQLFILGQGRMSGMTAGFPHRDQELYSWAFFQELEANNKVFSDVAAIESMRADVHGRFAGASSDPEPLKVRLVSGNYFSTLGVKQALGRVLNSLDGGKPGGHPVAVLSHAFWERRFSKDAGVVGRSVTINGTAYMISGVAAPEFFGTIIDESPDLWVPLTMMKQMQPSIDDPFENALSQSLWLITRKRSEVPVAQAQASTNVLFRQWMHEVAGPRPSAEQAKDMQAAHVTLYDGAGGISDLRYEFSKPLRILMTLVGLVLLIACANLANLLLARASGRQREIAVRLALGAERARLMRQLLSESLLLSLMGAVLGVLLAWWAGQALVVMVSAAPNDLASLDVAPNLRVLCFAFLLAVLTGILFGLAPALRMTRTDLGPSLKEGKGMARAQSRSRIGQALVAGQVALALFLMIGSALFVRTLRELETAQTGFDRQHVVLLSLDNQSSSFKGAAIMSLYGRLEQRVRALPRVRAASFSMLNYGEGIWAVPLWLQGAAHTRANSKDFDGDVVGAQYFETLGIPLVAGRTFGPQDTAQSRHVAVVNETLAKEAWPDGTAIGRHFSLAGRDKYDFEVIGMVKDAKYRGLRDQARGMWFVYTEQERDPAAYNDLVVRVADKPETLMAQIRAVIRSEDPNLAITSVATLGEMVDRSLGQEKLLAKLAGFFGLLALVLASIGLYGVMAYSVARRTNEIGIRMALGARPEGVLRMVLGESALLVGIGLAVGIPAALASGDLVSSQLYGLKANDPGTIAVTAALMLAVAMVASYIPALRAARLDPLVALREE